MKLVHSNIEYHFNFEEEPIQQLIIENKKEYFALTTELFRQCNKDSEDGNWVLSHGNILSLEKEALLLYDYYNFDLNTKKILNLLNAEILKVLTQYDYFTEINQLTSLLNVLNNKIVEEIDLPIEYSQELTFDDIVKVSKYQIYPELTLPTKILTYIDFYIKIKKIKLVILLNITQVLQSEELNTLLQELQYMGVKIFCIDGLTSKINLAHVTIVDEDLCII